MKYQSEFVVCLSPNKEENEQRLVLEKQRFAARLGVKIHEVIDFTKVEPPPAMFNIPEERHRLSIVAFSEDDWLKFKQSLYYGISFREIYDLINKLEVIGYEKSDAAKILDNNGTTKG